jgi:predicted DNA-binding transcriptional regulator AlpA
MDTLFIPTENDFKNWIKEAFKESLDASIIQNGKFNDPADEPLISRKEIGAFLGISMVTLNDWMKKGLPNNKVNGRVYFYRSEVLDYVKSNRRNV